MTRSGAPNPRGRKLYRPARRGWGKWLLSGLLVVVLAGPVVVDALSLTWRESEGCRVWAVIDGDTVRMNCSGRGNVTGQISGYDAPELMAGCPGELGLAIPAVLYLRWQLWTADKIVATPRGQALDGGMLTLMSADDELIATRMVEAGHGKWAENGRRLGWCGGKP